MAAGSGCAAVVALLLCGLAAVPAAAENFPLGNTAAGFHDKFDGDYRQRCDAITGKPLLFDSFMASFNAAESPWTSSSHLSFTEQKAVFSAKSVEKLTPGTSAYASAYAAELKKRRVVLTCLSTGTPAISLVVINSDNVQFRLAASGE